MTSASIASSKRKIALNYPAGGPLEETRWFSMGRISLITLLFAAPLAFGAVQTVAWAILSVVSVSLLLGWVLSCVRQNEIRIRWTPLYVPTALFLLLGMVQLLTGHTLDRIGTREAIIKLTTNLLIFFFVGQLFDRASRQFWHRFGTAVTLYAFAMSTFAIFQFFSEPNRIYWTVQPRWGGNVFGPYVNRNDYAGLMEMMIPIGAAFVLSQRKTRPGRWMLAFAITLSFASVLVSGSRAGLVSLLIESLLFGAILLAKSRRSGNRDFVLASFVLASGIALFLWVAPADVSTRLRTIVQSPELSYGDRKQMSFDSMRMFQDHPGAGVGLGSFQTAYTRYQRLSGDVLVDHAHNDFAEVLAETGLLGGLLILATLVLFFISAFRNSGVRFEGAKQWICFGAAVGCCGLIIHSFADFNLHIPANAAWFAFSAGATQLTSPPSA
jgi:O-antigen ligase